MGLPTESMSLAPDQSRIAVLVAAVAAAIDKNIDYDFAN